MSRYFRFGLRTILIVTTIAAALFGILGRDNIRARREKPIIDRIVTEGGTIRFEGDAVPPMDGSSMVPTEKPSFLQRQFGRHYGAYVEEVSFNGGPGNPTDETIQGLGGFGRLRKVSLLGRGFTDKCVDELLQVEHLKFLALFNTSISAAGVKRLVKCSELESLVLCDDRAVLSGDGGPSEFGNAHLESLSEFPALRDLTIGADSLTDEGFAHVGKCRDLTELTIYGATVTDDAFEHLTNLQQLQELYIAEVVVSEKSMKEIGKMRRLRVLQFDSILITDYGLSNLAGLTELEELHIRYDPYDTRDFERHLKGSGFAKLSSLKKLQKIFVHHGAINGEGIAAVALLPELTELRIDGALLTGQRLQQLKYATKLKHLTIVLSVELTLDDARQLKAKLPNCQIEWLDYRYGFSSGSL